MTEGLRTKDGLVRAYDEFVLVSAVNEGTTLIVIRFNDEDPQKGTVVDVGECVPDPLLPGDLIYFINPFKLENDLFSVHFGNILAFSKLIDG